MNPLVPSMPGRLIPPKTPAPGAPPAALRARGGTTAPRGYALPAPLFTGWLVPPSCSVDPDGPAECTDKLCPPLTCGDRLQTGLYGLAARLEERRKREPLTEVVGVLVRGEARTVGGDLEEHPAGLAEVDGTEVEAVYLRRHAKTEAPDPLPPCRVLLIIRRPESDVVNAAPPQARYRRLGSLHDQHFRPGPARPDLEDDGALIAPLVLVHLPEAEHLGEYPRRGREIPHRKLHRSKAPDTGLSRHRTALPRDTTRDPVVSTIVHEPQPLALGVGEGYEAATPALLDAAVLDAELRKPLGPEVQRLAPRHPELNRRNLARARVVGRDPQVRPVEEGHLRTRPPQLVTVEQVICRDVVLVDRLFYQP